MEAVGLHDFSGTSDDELSFKRGDVIKILSTEEDPNWYRAEKENRRGLVPKNYIQMKPQNWFLGKLTRKRAEEILQNKKNGTFLVRDSESTPGDFSLSVKHDSSIQHFKVLRDGAGKYFLWVVKFDSLNEMVEYHKTSSVSRAQKILLERPAVIPEITVTANFDFVAQDPGELPFKKGDELVVTDQSDPNWWQGRNKRTNQEGIFPVPYVSAPKES